MYLHVPFCAHRCSYCDFAVVTGGDDAQKRRYLQAVRADLARAAAAGPRAVAPPGTDAGASWPTFGSIFVGGGTPTEVSGGDLAGLLRFVRSVLPVAQDAEVTVEANPESVSADGVAALVGAGLTRLSIGAQSLKPHVLTFLDRRHDVAQTRRAVSEARAAGVAQISLDLIYGAPVETDNDWQETLEAAVSADVEHLSAYALTVESNTPYGVAVRRGQRAGPDDDTQANRMAAADRLLHRAGFIRYELSNWAKPGCASRHNLNYWRGGNWLAFGTGAHGHWGGRRWWNYRPLGRYVEAVLAGRSPTSGSEIPDQDQQRMERLLLGLRMVEGVPRSAVEPLDEGRLAALTRAGLLRDEQRRLRLTAAGFPLAHAVTVELLS